MIVKYQKLSPEAQEPRKGTPASAGFDLVATRITEHEKYSEFHTDLAMEIPEGWMGLIFPRSSISKTSASLACSVGVIDSDYRGEITIRFRNNDSYTPGDRVAQIILMPLEQAGFEEAPLTTTTRGAGGYGSTGR